MSWSMIMVLRFEWHTDINKTIFLNFPSEYVCMYNFILYIFNIILLKPFVWYNQSHTVIMLVGWLVCIKDIYSLFLGIKQVGLIIHYKILLSLNLLSFLTSHQSSRSINPTPTSIAESPNTPRTFWARYVKITC